MSDIIHLLPNHTADQIAAGEATQCPASVVKELVESTVGVGTSSIQVNIKDTSETLIQMIDDGRGMSETDARMAFGRHTTSKISTVEDLFSLRTMGFRDEALASIAAVAHIELRIQTRGVGLGIYLPIAGSNLGSIESEARNEGSIFLVKNLFFNVSAHRRFLRSNEMEFWNIINGSERIALVNPQVGMSPYHNDAEIFNLPESGLHQRTINIYDKSLDQELLLLDAQGSMATISGFVGRPDLARKRGALQFFFMNGRHMKHPYFHRAIMQAYEQLIPAGDMPNYFVHFTLDPSSADVNIHPTKMEIKFENGQPVWQTLMAAAREALAKSNAIPTIDFDVEDAIGISVYSLVEESEPSTYKAPKVQVDSSHNPFDTTSYKKPEFDQSKLYQGFENDRVATQLESESSEDASIEELPAEASNPKNLFTGVSNPCYQYKGRYIVTLLRLGLAIIDWYHAYVHILFDQYLPNVHQQQGASQQVLFPEIVGFTAAEMAVLPSLLEDLRFVGFDLSDLGNDNYMISGLPVGIENLDLVGLIKDIVDRAIETGCEVHEKIYGVIALSLARAAVIRPGKSLFLEEIDHLIASLFSYPDSNLIPDGKTVIPILTDEELKRRLKCQE